MEDSPGPLPAKEPLSFPAEKRPFIDAYLPGTQRTKDEMPYVTLTYATSLDAMLSVSPGVQTALSSKATKAMTHYLRAFHQGILVGVGTAEADDPTLDCRLEEVVQGMDQLHGKPIGHPVPIILDPNGRWNVSARSNVIRAAGRLGFGPIVLTTSAGRDRYRESGRDTPVVDVQGTFLVYETRDTESAATATAGVDWCRVFQMLKMLKIESVMVEGGGGVIRSILENDAYRSQVHAVILTIAPVWLGEGGVSTTPKKNGSRNDAVLRLSETRWLDIGGDGVLCGRISS